MPGDDEAVAGGAVYLPAHGVVVEDPPLTCGGLLFGTLDAERWSLLEANWMVDQEGDRLAQSGRSVAAMPYEGVVDTTSHPAFTDALSRYQRVASTARLVRPGTWVDSWHLAAVARSTQGTNVRMVGSERPRLWGAVFGEPQKLRGRRREYGDRVECRPNQVQWAQGPAYALDQPTVATVEELTVILGEVQAMAPDHGWWTAQRAFDRGNDIFVPRRARMAALFQVIEAPYGKRGEPGLGATVAVTMAMAGADRDEVAGYVEGDLRAIRNHVAHGRGLPDDVEISRDEQTLLELARKGLVHCADWIRGAQDSDGPYAPGPERTLARFRTRLGRDH
jgi:hypothetical protein